MAVFKDKYTYTWCSKFRYKDWTGETKQHKKCGFKTQKEAKEYERQFLDKLEGSSDITFSGLTNYYLEDCKARLRYSTFVNKEYLFQKHLLPYFGEYKINNISPVVVRSWQTAMMNKGYSATYLKTVNNQLSAIMNFAVRLYGLKQNPCHITGSMGKKKANLKNFWTPEEFEQFISYFANEPIGKTAFTVLFYSGMRIGELLALTYSDFNFPKNTLRINKSYAKIKNKEIISPPKTLKSNRTISMPVSVMEMVKDYFKSCNTFDISCRLFPVTKNYFERAIQKGCENTGVRKIRIHDIRHSHASMLMNLGVPIKQISERLGHENIETTLETYSHLYKEKEKELVDKLEIFASKMA